MFRAASQGPAKAITANRLGDGRVVFLAEGGNWAMDFEEASLFEDGPDFDTAMAYAKAQHDARIVVEPYAIDIKVENEKAVPARFRERIRADGPTVDYGDAERARLEGTA